MNNSPTELYKKYVTTHFEKNRRKTSEFSKTQERFFRENYSSFLPKNKDAKVVDLGCGLGNFLVFLESAGYTQIRGVDASEECVKFCKDNGFNVTVSAIIPYLENMTEKVDLFTLNDVLEHMSKEDMWRALSLIRKNLSHNGVCIIKVPNMSQPFMAADSRYIDITHEIGFTESSLRQVLRMSGFEKITIFGPNIYVFNGLKNSVARIVAGLFNKILRLMFALYGRTETKIFTKHVVAVVKNS